MKRILYISGLNKKRRKYDGERIKNTLIFQSLVKKYDVTLINLSHFRIFNCFRILFCGLFKKKTFDYTVISKDPHGANIILKILNIAKYPPSKVLYFEIGPFLYDRIINGSIQKNTFLNLSLIVVETNTMKGELESLGFNNIQVFPNFKPTVDIDYCVKKYPVDVLKLVFLSRIEEMKGIYDLIDVLSIVNKTHTKFELDVCGRIQSNEDKIKLSQYLKDYSFVHYCGKLDVGSKESYERLSKYDLHVFPTKYTEGFPGSLLDFFMAGVPTLSSSFARAHEILSTNDSIIFKQFDKEDLRDKLLYVYDNQGILSDLRKNSYDRRNDFSTDRFEKYLDIVIK